MTSLVDLTDKQRLADKQDKLFALLRGMERVIVAFSGGTDSAYLAWAAKQVLGANALAVTADSASIPESHKRDAEQFVRQFGISHEYIETHEFENPDYIKNDQNRCKYPKHVFNSFYRELRANQKSISQAQHRRLFLVGFVLSFLMLPDLKSKICSV